MPKLKGFEFLKTLSIRPQIIVTTAYQEFAIEGFELNVCDYLLKPFSFERFLKAVNKATSNISLTKPSETSSSTYSTEDNIQPRIFIKGDKVQHQIFLSDIFYIEACGNYCLVFLEDKKIITHQKISQFEIDLPQDSFIRTHKSYIVAIDKINSFTATHINIGGASLPIGQTYKSGFTKLLN